VLAQTVGRWLGGSEWAYRAVPFVASCAVLVLAAALSRRHLSAISGLTAVALLAFSTTLVYYAAEVKQYPVDVALALLMVWIIDSASRRRWCSLWWTATVLAGVVVIFTTYTSTFFLPVLGVVAFVDRRRDGRARKLLAACGAVWATAWIGSYLSWTRHLNDSDFLREFWEAGFLPLPPTSMDGLERWGGATRTLFTQLLPPQLLWLTVPLCLAGIWSLRNRPHVLATVVVPWLLVVFAASLDLYPAIERSVLFLIPGVAAGIGVGANLAGARLHRWGRVGMFIPMALLVALSAVPALERAMSPPDQEELRPLLATHDSELAGAMVVATTHAYVAWDYYADRLDLRPAHVIHARNSRHDRSSAAKTVASVDGAERVWLSIRPSGDPAASSTLSWWRRSTRQALDWPRTMLTAHRSTSTTCPAPDRTDEMAAPGDP
jgi:4-amino-4-deoxy-L-arabinose transferase-like glycosyltransferase